MDEAKKKRLEAAGWTMGDYGDFLGLTEAERQQVELRGALSDGIERLREAKGLTRRALGKMIGSTQAQVARVESGTTVEVTLDLMFRLFFAVGGKLEDLVTPETARSVEPEAPTAHPEPKPKPKRKRLAKQQG